MRRTSSPWWYSRTSTSSVPPTPMRRGRASPAAATAAAAGEPGQVEHLRGDDDLARGGERAVEPDQAERVGRADHQGAGAVVAAGPAEQRVLDGALPVRGGPVDEEARALAELRRHLVLELEQGGRQQGVVAEGDPAVHRGAEGDLGGLDGTFRRHPQPGPQDQDQRDEGEREEQQADPHDVALAAHHRAEQDHEPGADEPPAPDGQHRPHPSHRRGAPGRAQRAGARSGTRTSATARVMTSSALRWASWASADSSTRCARTGTARAWTSSGVT